MQAIAPPVGATFGRPAFASSQHDPKGIKKEQMEEREKRKQNRLSGFDYAQPGAYFVTICTKDRQNILSRISVGATFGRPDSVELTHAGRVVEAELLGICKIYERVRVDSYVVMPNHVHVIFVIRDEDGRPKVAPTVSRIVQQMKGAVTKRLGEAIWQKGYYDHVIRNEQDFLTKRKYIEENPMKWALDEYYL